jgi:transposase
MSGWNQAPLPRDQILLFRETLGDRIPPDHTVRLMWEMLDGLDWSRWEQHYVRVAGQPAIHPKVMAGAILYGLTHGLRSSRRLEWACGHALDFMWLVEGRTIDHSTLCGFRTRFKRELKDLFRQLGRVAMQMGLVSLNQVALDGTRAKANSSASATASAKTLEQRLAVLDEQIDKLLAEADQVDEREKDLFGDRVSVTTLPKELGDLKRRQEKLRIALAAAQQADAKRQKGKKTSKRSAKVPVADPESAIMPNKEGGYAPNYNPLAAADGARGIIVDADVLAEMNEAETVLPVVERIEANFGKQPEQFLADSTFGTGGNLSELAEQGIEALMPVAEASLPPENPAEREDPRQPVPAEDWPKLPRRSQSGKLDRAAFVYDAGQDCYWCPLGRALTFEQVKTKGRANGADSDYRVYRCRSCTDCGLAADCLAGKSKHRTVSHDQHEPARRAAATRLKSEAGKQAYARRAHLAETPNAVIKQVLGLRQFLLRGLDKVRTEWLWACTAFNLKKLIRAQAVLRAAALPRTS